MKKHAEQESEVPGAKTVPEGAAANQAESGKAEGTASEAQSTTPDAASGKESAAPGDKPSAGDKAAAGEKASTGAGQAEKDAPKKPDPAERIAELERKCAEIQDQYLRKAADFDNYRKRMIKEKQDAIDYANANLLVDLVQVLDDFDRALQASSAAPEASASDTHGAAMLDGVLMIRKQLGGLLESKYGLAYYPSKGAAFDPAIHEAISSVPRPDVKEPTVSEEFVKGYKLKDRVIRVAKVVVGMPVENQGQ
ncbi:MAG TPA: nucleotide exchange factor GrpE [Treponemataceae bacterium]|nr:nucleotide exchange factor GrpE [Treponemataceae bacterium]